MPNGHLRNRAIEMIEKGGATQHEKLDLLLQIVLDDGERFNNEFDKLYDEVKANPLSWIPKQWRARAAGFFVVWVLWVSAHLFGIDISIPDIITFLKGLLI